MQSLSTCLSLLLLLAFSPAPTAAVASATRQSAPAPRQLLAVRGEIVKIKVHSKGMLLITVRPSREFAEVSVLARENDLVGSAAGRVGDPDLFGLLSGDLREEETISAGELNEGDMVSVIYDPQLQNRALEIYLRQ